MKSGKEIEQLIQQAVNAAVTTGMDALGKRVQTAIDLGIEVGAAAGAEAAAAVSAKIAERERRKLKRQQQDRRYHDTKLLIRKYRQLNAYYQNAVFDEEDAEAVDEDFAEIMRGFGYPHADETLTADSIRRNYLVSRIIMAHVNTMLAVYGTMCQNTNRAEDKRRWRVLHALYLADEPSTAEQIADREGIERRTVYRDIDACLSDLAVMFFGIDGLERYDA